MIGVRRPTAYLHRVYSWVVAAFIGTAGLILIGVDDGFRTPSTSVAYDTFAPQTWGYMFVASALLFAVFHRRRSAAAPMAFVMLTWAAMLAHATLFHAGASPTGWIWPSCIAALLTVGIARGDL